MGHNHSQNKHNKLLLKLLKVNSCLMKYKLYKTIWKTQFISRHLSLSFSNSSSSIVMLSILRSIISFTQIRVHLQSGSLVLNRILTLVYQIRQVAVFQEKCLKNTESKIYLAQSDQSQLNFSKLVKIK